MKDVKPDDVFRISLWYDENLSDGCLGLLQFKTLLYILQIRLSQIERHQKHLLRQRFGRTEIVRTSVCRTYIFYFVRLLRIT